ncbi:hypothetical protein DSO57_1007845 [Entomophthora muscae]|uniref:Uncharacterized protein n=1 Tax=Entomophthora muscae TaxID=34485 RepID=A0ACC2RYJ6_9FUNG|nr:hypothetical protein DSO57_1007845 [Entomophthora muscae]
MDILKTSQAAPCHTPLSLPEDNSGSVQSDGEITLLPEGHETRISTNDLEKQHTKLVNSMKVITTGKSCNGKPNQAIGLRKWLHGQYCLKRTWDSDKLSVAISDAVQACDLKKMVKSDAKANQEEEFKDLSHKPEVNLKQVDALNGNAIYFSLKILFTFGTPAKATTIKSEVNVTSLPLGVMTNTASSLADASVGLGNCTNNNSIDLSEENMNETIEFPQPRSPATDLTPANELSTETLQDVSKVIVNHCTTEDLLDDIWNRKAWKIMAHVTLDALYFTLKSAKGEAYSETMDQHNGLISLQIDWIYLGLAILNGNATGYSKQIWNSCQLLEKPIPEELS